MQKDREYLSEELKKLANRFLASEEVSDLEQLKIDYLAIYEDLILLIHEMQKQMSSMHPFYSAQPDVKSDENARQADPEIPSEIDELKESIGAGAIEESMAKKENEPEQEYPTLSDLFVPTFNDIKEDMSQKEEFKDTVSLEETEKLFETKKEEIRQLSLNDRLLGNSIQVGLNDRIAFVNKLFNFSQSDFNKVLNRLNEFSTKDEALHYVQYQVKVNYNWKGKEDLEERFISLIERKFMI